MRKFLFTIFSFLSSFILICDVNAVSNINDFSHLTIADSGAIYNNSNDSAYNSVGYAIDEASFGTGSTGQPYSFVTTTTNLQTVFNGYGASISQCGFNFQQGHNYSLTFYFMSDEYNDIKYSLDYTRKTNKLGISNFPSGSTSFNPLSSESGVNNYVNKPYYVSWYSIVFKAPSSGSCITSAFSTSPTYTHTTSSNFFMYLGYFYDYLGEGNLTADEIQNALENSFNNVTNNINSSINSATNSINSNIDNATGQINSNIDSMKDKQDETNTKLDEQNETSKGIWGSLKDGIANIGKWFVSLGESIGNFFASLIDALKTGFDFVVNKIVSLFVGEETKECTQITNYFGGFTYKNRILSGSVSVLPYETGWITVRPGTHSYSYDYIQALEPDTEYTFIIETSDTISTEVYFNSTNEVNGHHFQFLQADSFTINTSDTNKRLFKYVTTPSDFSNADMSYYITFGNTSNSYSDITFRGMLIKGHWDESNADFDYFQGHKEVCTVTGSSTGLFGMITNLGKSIGEWFGNLTSAIGNFFTELLDGIIEGLKALFVPTDEQLLEIIDASKDLSENFGFIGEAISFFITIFTSLLGLVNANGCVELPAFKMGATSLFKEHTFWEVQTVCLSDNVILADNIDTIRAVTSIALVCMFITFAASKFFSILSKNDSERASDDADMVRSGY